MFLSLKTTVTVHFCLVFYTFPFCEFQDIFYQKKSPDNKVEEIMLF